MNIYEKAYQYAVKCHADTNHTYDGNPYSHHLAMVEGNATKFLHLIPEDDQYIVLAACYCHDLIEDTRQTYNDVEKATSTPVANIVYALTNEKGKNRKERANDKYYEGIRTTKYATFVKICDRLANLQQSISTGSRMFELYVKENNDFVDKLFDRQYREMFDYLDSLLVLNSSTK